jgi:signal transduction histidine kinase
MRVAVLSTAIALLLFLIPLALAVFDLSVADARSRLAQDALNAVAQIDPQFSTTDPPEVPAPSNPATQLALYDRGGTRVVGTGPARADLPVRQALAGTSTQGTSGGLLIEVIPVSQAEQTVGAVRAALPLSSVILADVGVWLIMLAAASFCMLVGILIARASVRAVVAPVDDLISTVRALGNGEFTARTTPSGVAEIDAAGVALADTANRLGALVEHERHLSQDASHQLRTPLAGLRALLEQAQSQPGGPHDPLFPQALERVDTLSRTIDDFLSTEHRAPGRSIDVGTELRELSRRWHGVFAEAGRPLRIDAPLHVEPVVTVARTLHQVLDALLENALVHGAGMVEVRARETHGALAIDVEDQGGGIRLEDAIFQRGYSTARRSGVGLALARQLADELGGTLLLSAREPTTRFTILLRRESSGSRTGTPVPPPNSRLPEGA